MSGKVSLPLNQGQQAAADGFFAFLFSEDKEMKLSGPAGVGKTYVMGYLIDEIMPRYQETCKLMGVKPEYHSVVMTATTNKAAEVLSHSTKRPVSTIHSFLNLKVEDDWSTGRSYLTKTNMWTVYENMIVFIDEGFTADTPLYNLVHEGTHNCKIVWVGDHAQLGPVMETVSPVHRIQMPSFELTQPMRNADQPALMQVCQQLRNTVETGKFSPIKIVPGVIDLADGDMMEREIHNAFSQQTADTRILAYTNNRVIDYNEYIRAIRHLPAEYQLGEVLIVNQAIRLAGKMLHVEDEVEIIRQDKNTFDEYIDQDITLKLRMCSLRSSLGVILDRVLLPVDRAHYQACVKWYQKRRNWPKYFQLKQTYPDLRPRDAATIHKAQGSTYDTVFIDLENLNTCNQPNVVARLLHVGFSRPRNRVILYGNLAEKYGGLIV